MRDRRCNVSDGRPMSINVRDRPARLGRQPDAGVNEFLWILPGSWHLERGLPSRGQIVLDSKGFVKSGLGWVACVGVARRLLSAAWTGDAPGGDARHRGAVACWPGGEGWLGGRRSVSLAGASLSCLSLGHCLRSSRVHRGLGRRTAWAGVLGLRRAFPVMPARTRTLPWTPCGALRRATAPRSASTSIARAISRGCC